MANNVFFSCQTFCYREFVTEENKNHRTIFGDFVDDCVQQRKAWLKKKKTKIKTLKELALFGVFAFNNFNIENYFQILGKYSLQNYC